MGGAVQTDADRYLRQTTFAPLGLEGQRRLAASSVLIVGVGGLGTHSSELLARAGVGRIRIADADRIETINLHRQGLYDEADVRAGRTKVQAAARRLRAINSTVAVEPVEQRVGPANIAELADGVQLILDGTDSFPTRFVINDYCVSAGLPWVFAGAVKAEGQVMTIIPGRTACLRCIFPGPPPPQADPKCLTVGVLGPLVAAIASIQATEALKLLSGNDRAASPYLLKIDLWGNTTQRIDATAACQGLDCPCCKQRRFEFLHPSGS